eukprot:Opistho-2@31508
MFCWRATRAPFTCRAPHIPRSCQQSSAHCARPVAPSGCPFEMRPPDGFTTYFPPYVLSPRSINSPALPTGQSPSASYVISSLQEKQSWSSTTCTASRVNRALANALSAARRVMSNPTILMQLPSANAPGVSVVISMARISTARSSRRCLRTKSSLHTIAAPAPSDVGQHCSMVSGANTSLDFSICSRVYSSRNCEYGLLTECLWFFHAIFAKCRAVVPYFSICSRPALPNICGAMGAGAMPLTSDMRPTCFSIGLQRSLNFAPSDPRSIFSKPRAMAHSHAPPATKLRARKRAVDPVEQLLFTLYIGIPVMPSSYSAR